jgi:hypothetical protein
VGRFPKREIEEPVELSGRKRKDPVMDPRLAGLGRALHQVNSTKW